MASKKEINDRLNQACNFLIEDNIFQDLEKAPLFLSFVDEKNYEELFNLVNKVSKKSEEDLKDYNIKEFDITISRIKSDIRRGKILPRYAYLDDEETVFLEMFNKIKDELLINFYKYFPNKENKKLVSSNYLEEDYLNFLKHKKDLVKNMFPNIEFTFKGSFFSRVEPSYRLFSTYTFKDAKPRLEDKYYNFGDVKLRKRLNGDLINQGASKEMNLMLLDEMIRMSNYKKISENVHTPTYEYLQYVDITTNWGGVGNLFMPQKELINHMHKNGVKITGNIFMAPEVYGGYYKEIEAFVKKKNGVYVVGRNLVDIARLYGFDGWFFNIETESVTKSEAKDLILMMRDMQKYDKKKYPGNETLEIIWYDSLTIDGGIRNIAKDKYTWQGELNSVNKPFFTKKDGLGPTAIFLNFGPHDVGDSDKVAKEVGHSPFSVYRGFDHEPYGPTKSNLEYESSYDGFSRKFEKGILDNKGNPRVSIGFYMASHIFNLDYRGKNPDIPPYANNYFYYQDRAKYFYTGISGNPCLETKENLLNKKAKWTGISALKNDKTVNINDYFITNFNTGNGIIFTYNEKNISPYPKDGFNNIEMQDPMPSFRYLTKKDGIGKPLSIKLDHKDSYFGPASLKVLGFQEKDGITNTTLYRTYIKASSKRPLKFIIKTKNKDLLFAPVLTFLNSKNEWFKEKVSLDIIKLDASNKYTSYTFSLAGYENKIITSIGFKIKTIDNKYVDLNIGEISIISSSNMEEKSIENLKILGIGRKDNKFDLRLTFDKISNKELLYYIYLKKGSKIYYLKASYSNYIYLSRLPSKIKNGGYELLVLAKDYENMIEYKSRIIISKG